MRKFEELVKKARPNQEEVVTETMLGRAVGKAYQGIQRVGNTMPYVFYGNQRGPTETKGKYSARMLIQNGKTDDWKTYHAGYTPVLINFSERYSNIEKDINSWISKYNHGTEASEYPTHCITLFDSGIDYSKKFDDQKAFINNLFPNVKKPNSNGRYSYYAQYRFSANQRGIDPIGAMSAFGESVNFAMLNNNVKDAYALVFERESNIDIGRTTYDNDKTVYLKNVANIFLANGIINQFVEAMEKAETSSTADPLSAAPSASPSGGSSGGPSVVSTSDSYLYDMNASLVLEDGAPLAPSSTSGGSLSTSPDTENQPQFDQNQTNANTEKSLLERMQEVVVDKGYDNDYGKSYLSKLIALRVTDNEFSIIKNKLISLNSKLKNPESLVNENDGGENDLYDICGVIAFPRESMNREDFMSNYFRSIVSTCGMAIQNVGQNVGVSFSDDFIFVPKNIADELNKSTGVIKAGMLSASIQTYAGKYIGRKFNNIVNKVMGSMMKSKIDSTSNIINNSY